MLSVAEVLNDSRSDTYGKILDSRREEFRLSKAYEQKIDVVNVITAPEIEMLIIHAEGAYDQFKRSGKKQANFVKQIFGCMM